MRYYTTTILLLAVGKKSQPRPPSGESSQESPEGSEHTGIFTSGIVSTRAGQRNALFFTGRQHAGKNLADVLAQRAQQLGPPIQMCDGLARNLPKEFQAVVANCIAHGRRKFVEVAAKFPEECRYVLETLGEVYKHDAFCREQGRSADERLGYHQTHSGPFMKALENWFTEQCAKRKVEPNSGLGEAILYTQRRWQKLTLFLRQAGVPLDHNICERALKEAILHRKNASFYKTQNGAHVGDLFMSLIHTCQLCGANPFHYLTELQQHFPELARTPAAENNRFRPAGSIPSPQVTNAHFRAQNPAGCLAAGRSRHNCCMPASMPVSPLTTRNSTPTEPRHAGIRRPARLDNHRAGQRSRFRSLGAETAGEVAGSGTSPRNGQGPGRH